MDENNIILTFSEEHEDRSFSGLVFTLDEIVAVSSSQIVLRGKGSTNNQAPEQMFILYLFAPNEKRNEREFYRIKYSISGRIRRVNALELDKTNSPEDIHNIDVWKRLLLQIKSRQN